MSKLYGYYDARQGLQNKEDPFLQTPESVKRERERERRERALIQL